MKDRRKKRLAQYIENDLQGDRGFLIARSGLTKGRIAQLLNPDEAFGELAADNLARRLGLRSGYFEEEPIKLSASLKIVKLPQPKVARNEPADIIGDNFRIPTQFPLLPVISWVIAGTMKEIDVIPDPDVGEWPMEMPNVHIGPRSWVLIVVGDSMDDGTKDGVPAGHILLCDPDADYEANCLVIAKNVETQSATFKQLISEDGRWFLKAWNKDSDFGTSGRMKIDDPDLRVIARVMFVRPPYRKV